MPYSRMHDGISFARGLADAATDSIARLGAAVRRWTGEADAARALWQDNAASDIFSRHLDPHLVAVGSAVPAIQEAGNSHERALTHSLAALELTQHVADVAAAAATAARHARDRSATARAQAGIARGDAGRARSIASSVMSQLAGLGG